MGDAHHARFGRVYRAPNVLAWDSNCPQHIPQRFEAAEVNSMLAERDKRIEDLTKELDRLRKTASTPK